MLRVSSLVLASLAKTAVVARDTHVSLPEHAISASATLGRRSEVKVSDVTFTTIRLKVRKLSK